MTMISFDKYKFRPSYFTSPFQPGVPQVITVTHRPQAGAARNVSVPCGGRGLKHVTQSLANVDAGSGQRDSHVTSAWKGMRVDQLGSSVRLTHNYWLFFFFFLTY